MADRWDSLALFTPRRYDALPDASFRGDPDAYPTRDEVVSHLTAYAQEPTGCIEQEDLSETTSQGGT
jgi:cation diffusion facilitator CzcD-associated flavoprotein CzcO